MKKNIREDGMGGVAANAAAANANASGAPIDGIGVGPRGEPGIKKKKLRQIIRRKVF
jgi:hypothetical protein